MTNQEKPLTGSPPHELWSSCVEAENPSMPSHAYTSAQHLSDASTSYESNLDSVIQSPLSSSTRSLSMSSQDSRRGLINDLERTSGFAKRKNISTNASIYSEPSASPNENYDEFPNFQPGSPCALQSFDVKEANSHSRGACLSTKSEIGLCKPLLSTHRRPLANSTPNQNMDSLDSSSRLEIQHSTASPIHITDGKPFLRHSHGTRTRGTNHRPPNREPRNRHRKNFRPPGRSSSFGGKVAVMCVSDAIDITELEGLFKENDYVTYLRDEVLHVTNIRGYSSPLPESDQDPRFDLFIFPYGSIVWWGTDMDSYRLVVERDFLVPHNPYLHGLSSSRSNSTTQDYIKERYSQRTLEELFPLWLTFTVRESKEESSDDLPLAAFIQELQHDHVLLQSHLPAYKQSISHALAQSAKLDVLEPLVAELLFFCKPLPLQLSMKGRAQISPKKVNQLKGELFLYRMVLRDVLDEPDFLWEFSWFSPFYDMVKEDYSIETRVLFLEEKLEGVHDILQMLGMQFSQQHNTRLEWIIILLIVAAVVIAVFQLWVQVKRIARMKHHLTSLTLST